MPTFLSSPSDYMFFFDVFPSNPQIFFWSTYCSSLDRHSWVGTCIQRYRNVPTLICRWRAYRTTCTNELLDLCMTFVND